MLLVVGTWLLQPGWVGEWLHVREKTVVTSISPTVWGLSSDLVGEWWPLLGLVLTLAVVLWLGWLLLTRVKITAAHAIALALAGSLFVTPYAWAYEHTLLLLPIMVLAQGFYPPRLRVAVFFLLVFALPWALYAVANHRGLDTLSSLVPLAVIVALLVMALRENPSVEPASEHIHTSVSAL